MSKMNFLTPHTIATQFIGLENENLTLADQARLLGISRSSLYYQPKPIDPQTLDLMKRIDKIHTDCPEYGARKIAKQIRIDIKTEVELALQKQVYLLCRQKASRNHHGRNGHRGSVSKAKSQQEQRTTPCLSVFTKRNHCLIPESYLGNRHNV